MLGRRLKKANEIAKKRAERIRSGGGPLFTPEQLQHLEKYPPSKKDRPHKDVEGLAFEPGHFRKFNGTCSCPTCKYGRQRFNGKGKNKRAWMEDFED